MQFNRESEIITGVSYYTRVAWNQENPTYSVYQPSAIKRLIQKNPSSVSTQTDNKNQAIAYLNSLSNIKPEDLEDFSALSESQIEGYNLSVLTKLIFTEYMERGRRFGFTKDKNGHFLKFTDPELLSFIVLSSEVIRKNKARYQQMLINCNLLTESFLRQAYHSKNDQMISLTVNEDVLTSQIDTQFLPRKVFSYIQNSPNLMAIPD